MRTTDEIRGALRELLGAYKIETQDIIAGIAQRAAERGGEIEWDTLRTVYGREPTERMRSIVEQATKLYMG